MSIRIGLSYSRCVKDIIEENINMRDVLVIITGTDFNPTIDAEWSHVWKYYTATYRNAEWSDLSPKDEDRYRNTTIKLYKAGKLHQPRQFGGQPEFTPYHWLDVSPTPSDREKNPALLRAWDNYMMLARLAGIDSFKEAK